jgi:hypothetical protein
MNKYKELIMAEKRMVGTAPGQESLGADDCMGLLGDLIAKLRAKPPVITKRQLQLFLEKQNPFAAPTKLVVNGDSPRWQGIRQEDYFYVNDALTVADFLVAPGTREVTYDVGSFDHDPTTQEVVDWQNEPGFRPLDRAESETYLDAVPDSKAELGKSSIVCQCSVAGGHVPCVYLDFYGRNLDRTGLDDGWSQGCRFVRARK